MRCPPPPRPALLSVESKTDKGKYTISTDITGEGGVRYRSRRFEVVETQLREGLLTSYVVFFSPPPQPQVGQGLLTVESSRSHSWHTALGNAPVDVWSSRRRDLYLTILTTDIHALGGIRTHNPSKRATVDPRLRPPGHRDRRYIVLLCLRNNLFRLRAGNRGIVVPFPGDARKLSFCLKRPDSAPPQYNGYRRGGGLPSSG